MSKKAIIIDGNSLIYRSFYATLNQLEYYKQHNFPPANAIKLVTLTVLKLLNEQQYDYALFALDHHKKTFRTEEFADYKAGRKPMPDDLIIQLPEISKAINALGIKTMSIPNIEADDIIGSYCKLMNQSDVHVTVFTSDKDMLQLVNEKTHVSLFKTGISERDTYTHLNFSDKFFGLKPNQIPDYKGIAGDSSDNLCGVKGIGPKTAINLLIKYNNFEEIYNHLDELNEGQRTKFNQSKDHAKLCKTLATIRLDVLDKNSINEFIKESINKDEMNKLIEKYHFKNIVF